MGADAWGFDEERQRLARSLRRRKRTISLADLAVSLAFLAVLLAGGSLALRAAISSLPLPSWTVTSLFVLAVAGAGTLLRLPASFLAFRVERAFDLSTQRSVSWASDRAKGSALGLAAVLVSGNVLVWLMAQAPDWWWIAAWALGLLVSAVLGFVAPVLLAPLFLRFRPLQDEGLRARFQALAARARVPVIGVFEMAASVKTRRSNAAVMGFGRTRRVVITDTMLAEYTPEEIESVLAHELGHQRFLDPVRGLLEGAGISLLVLFLASMAYAATWPAFGFASPHDVAALPLLVAYAGIVSEILGPGELVASRRREARADRFALETTRNPSAFQATMVKLHDRNLGVAHPRAWEIWLFYSHPPGQARIELARSFAASLRVPG